MVLGRRTEATFDARKREVRETPTKFSIRKSDSIIISNCGIIRFKFNYLLKLRSQIVPYSYHLLNIIISLENLIVSSH